jgi:hypothetical protein
LRDFIAAFSNAKPVFTFAENASRVLISFWSALNGLSRSRLRKDPARPTRSRFFALC